MNFSTKKRVRKSHISLDSTSLLNNYPSRLTMYKNPPAEEITLEEFERFAVDRLKLLREIENINIRFKKNDDNHYNKMKTAIEAFSPKYFEELSKSTKVIKQDKDKEMFEKEIELGAERRKDHISHFILRLAFARSEDLRRWFLAHEMELFRFKFVNENSIETFLEANTLKYTPIEDKEKESLKEQLQAAMFNYKEENFQKINFYKVPFTSVLDLVRSRKVYLSEGQAYVPEKELVSIIIGIYRAHLSQALALTAKKLPYLEEDTRLLPLLKNLSSAYIGDTFSSSDQKDDKNKLSLANLEEAVTRSFPICMRNLHEGLKRDNHLKHFGRLQYGLFLKAAGLTLEESLLFWRTEFTKKIDLEKFDKQYAYNIRHSYGKEGKRANYTPYSCMKVITSNQPGPGDCHGCPFKHSDTDLLKKRLQSYKLPNDGINEILDLMKQQHYQVACSRYFEVTHKVPEGVVSINHPNQYFDESRKILSGEKPVSSYVQVVKKEIKQENVPPPTPPEINDVDFDDNVDVL